jgi:hypothetical protein
MERLFRRVRLGATLYQCVASDLSSLNSGFIIRISEADSEWPLAARLRSKAAEKGTQQHVPEAFILNIGSQP